MQILIKDLSFAYNPKKDPILKQLNFSMKENKIIFIMGPSGCGKTTLIQHFNGLLKPSKGLVSLEFEEKSFVLDSKININKLKPLREKCALLFQFPEHQLFEINVLKEVMYGPLNFLNDEEKSEKKSKLALSKVGLNESFYERSPLQLSGGEKRKVAIASILSYDPNVLILDEPTSNLDSNAINELKKIIIENKKSGKMVVVVSHDVDFAYEMAEEIILINNGEIISYTNPYTLFSQNEKFGYGLKSPFVYKIIKSLNLEDKSIKSIDEVVDVLRGKNNG